MPLCCLHSNSPDCTIALARDLAAHLRPGMALALTGELGSGKTLFVKGLAKGLGHPDVVVSPSFTLINEYDSPGRTPLYHCDWYRLTSSQECEALGFSDYLGGDGVIVVEWADRVPEVLPAGHLSIHFKAAGPDERVLEISASGDLYSQLLEEWKTCSR